ncbi:uncharacterized protein Dwil_GK27800 [Drosophila willistoni]|uniref:Odorant receptor n=1 Tax=Drosophila willistoni TaxID=7260 RepID=A0A0Q9WS96_DROWI|nr:uncharacterized protein Dwil_GK27800 [Drosophila willistoni]
MIFELLRKPGPQDMKSSTDAFTYFEYGMTAVGWLPPSRGRKLYLMFRGLVIIWCIVYLPFGMIMGCVKDIKDYKPGEFLTLLETVLNDAGCSLKILALYLYLPKYEKTKNLLERLDEFFNLFFFADFWIGLLCVVYIFGLMSQTFPFCYVCDLIINDCDRLALALFHSNWTGSSRRYKSTLIQFIHNAQQPITFTAGSIFPICMQTNIKVAKLAFSVVTFIKQMNIVEKSMKN